MKDPIELIQEERRRQIAKGCTPDHDDDIHNGGELAAAAAVYASLICDSHFNVSTFSSCSLEYGKRFCFVGTELDRKIAIYVFHFLVGHFRREWRQRKGRIRNRRAFMYGAYLGLNSKLRESRSDEDNGLAVVRTNRSLVRDAYCAQNFGGFTSREITLDTKATAAMNSGWSVGRKTEIRPAVETVGVRGHLPAQTEGER